MGWKSRKGKRYFYRSERISGRVISHYIGNGELAQIIDQFGQMRQEERELERAAEREYYAEFEAEDAEVERIEEMVSLLMKGALIADGFHQLKRIWRRKRYAESITSIEDIAEADAVGRTHGAD